MEADDPTQAGTRLGRLGSGEEQDPDHDQDACPRGRLGARRLPPWAVLVLVGLGAAWLVSAVDLTASLIGALYDQATNGITFFGEQPTEWGGRDEAQGDALRLAWISLLPTAGLVLALNRRRPVLAALYGAAALLGLVAALVAHDWVTPDQPSWQQDDRPRVCQEHSGGDTRCPGG
ncbi:hypothetical protein [Blastococcus sp. TF02A-35]|uniref:hypothetical protein n=1 Tax=Blastococcus sp. TF02A-35 TaxID=2559612 RepID=UPI00107480A8|nr:hypothetical protein [Blastococcus sp. TF02A_35]TFV53820.1 hypothetical protein E4P43_00795 [Blastococcus sp. TF02A_35]